ncbi:MAG: hydrolase [Planctomycetota bacterium]
MSDSSNHNETIFWPRSPLMMNVDDTALVIVDIQERLLPSIENGERLVASVKKLIEAAIILGVETAVTQQYPKGLGATVESLAEPLKLISNHPFADKTMFSCRECDELFDRLSRRGVSKILLCGIETHVCIAQSALDLMTRGFEVYLSVDAVGSRKPVDHRVALRRLESAGCTLTTSEAAIFEWCVQAGSDKFKRISKLIKESI